MENIIKKAIEGGWKPFGSIKTDGKNWGVPEVVANFYNQPTFILDPLFWQALGKACGWEGFYTKGNEENGKRNITDLNPRWEYYALRFHEINLTQSWDKAVEWLEELLVKE